MQKSSAEKFNFFFSLKKIKRVFNNESIEHFCSYIESLSNATLLNNTIFFRFKKIFLKT